MANEPQGRNLARIARAAVLTPPRTALILTLGTLSLGGRAIRRTLDAVLEEGERQLDRFNGFGPRTEQVEAEPGDVSG